MSSPAACMLALLGFLQPVSAGEAPADTPQAETLPEPAPDSLFADWRFAVGERHEYKIKVGPVQFGQGVFFVEGKEEIRGETTHRLVLRVEGKVLFFLDITNEQTSWVKTGPALETLKFREVSAKGRDRVYEIFPETRSYRSPSTWTTTNPAAELGKAM